MNDDRHVVVSGVGNVQKTVELASLMGSLTGMPYSDQTLEKLFKHIDKKDKIFKDCPHCGTKRVNIYYKDGKWQCKNCWDAETKLIE